MPTLHTAPLTHSNTLRATLHEGGAPMRFGEVLRSFVQDPQMASAWSSALASLPFPAFCFEAPPLTQASLNAAFECVFVPSPALERARMDPRPFAAHFRQDRRSVVFRSLGGDATLIAPCPAGPEADLTHLASFSRTASAEQTQSLWRDVGEALLSQLGARPLWLSTAGLGVSWLHVRIDQTPKYYRHGPYRER